MALATKFLACPGFAEYGHTGFCGCRFENQFINVLHKLGATDNVAKTIPVREGRAQGSIFLPEQLSFTLSSQLLFFDGRDVFERGEQSRFALKRDWTVADLNPEGLFRSIQLVLFFLP